MSTEFALGTTLPPIAARIGSPVREHEMLRIAAILHGKDTEKAADEARRQVLAWAQNRSGGRLPKEAWDCASFEYFAGGRNSLAVRLHTDDADIWGIRAEDPDKAVPGRVWTTEVVIGAFAGQRARFSARQLVNTAETQLQVEPHTPGFVRQVVDVCGLSIGLDDLDDKPWQIGRLEEAEELLERILDPARTLPLVVLSGDERSDTPSRPMLDADALARAVLGLAHVVVLPADFTRVMSTRLGSRRSVFHGGVRYYLPGFSASSDPFQHRLFTSNLLADPAERVRAVRWLRSVAAEGSLRRNRLGREVLAFGDIRNASLRARRALLAEAGASEGEQLAAARSSIAALEGRLDEAQAMQDFFDVEAEKEKDRAETAETQLRAGNYHIQQLLDRLAAAGAEVDSEVALPEDWSAFADWCDLHFAGRLALTPAARRGAKDAELEDVGVAARCIQWLATIYRNGRIEGADGDFRDTAVEDGVRNSLCGGDEFETEWQGRRHTVDWHIKNGGNTRDPRRCLRIYFFWEPETQQVVVADLPHHRRSAAS